MLLLQPPPMKHNLTHYFQPFVSEIDRHYSHMSWRGFLFGTVEGQVIIKDIQDTENLKINDYLKIREYWEIKEAQNKEILNWIKKHIEWLNRVEWHSSNDDTCGFEYYYADGQLIKIVKYIDDVKVWEKTENLIEQSEYNRRKQ